MNKELAKIIDVNSYSSYHEMVDALEVKMLESLPLTEVGISHTFTPGMYSREMLVSKGTLLTSKLHLTRHQFVVTKGSMLIYHEEDGWIKVSAPYHGITEAGTRRIGIALEDSIWTTFHPSNLVEDKAYTDKEMEFLVQCIEKEIIGVNKQLKQ